MNLQELKKLIQQRHSEYDISAEWVAPQEEVQNLLANVLQHVPSAFNSQPVRIVLLTGNAHLQHWDIIEKELIARLGQEAYQQQTQAKIHNSFRSGIATILYFTDTNTVTQLQEQYPTYAHNFPLWAEQVQGSHQYAVWVGLTALGFGASLQHYIGMVDDQIKQHANVPNHWQFVGHMPFGKIGTPATNKEKLPLTETLIIR